LASIQEKLLEKSVKYGGKSSSSRQPSWSAKSDTKQSYPPTDMWKARQLREHRRANGLCFKCGGKFVPGHKCADNSVPASLAQITSDDSVGDGGEILSEEVLNALELSSEECFLSLNAISGTQSNRVIHLRALVQNQVLSILIDLGSSHTFLTVHS
jgi:hypothetical protein